MMDWVAWLQEASRAGPTAMVSVLAVEGSAPRDAGTRMIVAGDRVYGTIGGGALEFRAIEQARAILGQPAGAWRIQDYPLGPLLGQCCGGRVRLLVEHVDAARLAWLDEAAAGRGLVSTLTPTHIDRRVADDAAPGRPTARGYGLRAGDVFAEALGTRRRPLYLFGAGHVGQAIARHADSLPFRLAWFDTRASFEAAAGVTLVPEPAIEQCVDEAPDEAALVILTHDHAIDYRLTKAALRRPPTAFTGLIGSRTKRARFLSRLEREGIGAAARARLVCPIGVEGVVGKEPDVIAIAVLAQLLQLRARETVAAPAAAAGCLC